MKSGTEKLKENEGIRNILEKADEKLDALRANESLKSAVDKAEGFSKNTNEAFWSGVKKFFDKPVEAKDFIETEITDITDLEEVTEDTDDFAGEE